MTDEDEEFLTGLRGSGKTVQLLRLKQDLQRRGFAVVMFSAEDYLNMHEPLNVVDVLLFLVGAISDQAVEYDLIAKGDSATSRGWSRLGRWLSDLASRMQVTGADVGAGVLATTVTLKAELRRDTAFVVQLREFLRGRLSELVEQTNDIVADLVAEMRARWTDGEWKGLIVIVDSLDHNRAVDSEKFQQVRRALVNLFDKDYDNLRLADCRTVFTLPMYVPISAAKALRRVTNLRVTDRERKPNADGVTAARQVLLQRVPDGRLDRLLSSDDADRLVLASGGHLRILLGLVMEVVTQAESLPVDAATVTTAIEQVRNGTLPLADDQRAMLRTDDLATQRVLRERVRANRRVRAYPLTVLEPSTPAELAGLLDELEARGAAPPGCTWVAASRLADEDWLAAWRVFLLTMNHRRDVLRAQLGGLVIAAPQAVKVIAQRESPDLWSVRDLLVEPAPRPVITRGGTERRDDNEPRRGQHTSQGLGYDSTDPELADEAQVLLAMPVAELAGPARERVSRAVQSAVARGEHQVAAVLLMAQSDGYDAAGDPAGALHLVQEALTLDDVESRTRELLLNSGVDLATTISELELAREYAAESVALAQQRVTSADPETLRDLSISLDKLGNVARDLGDFTAARTYYQQAFDIDRRLAEQLDTPQAHGDLSISLSRLGNVVRDLGDPTTARTHHRQALDIDRRLAGQLGTAQALRNLRVGLGDLAWTEEELGNAAAAALRAELATVEERLTTLSDGPSG